MIENVTDQERQAVDMLLDSGASCVILSRGEMHLFRQRGVRDLYDLLELSPELLRGAFVADKVVGKGAASLMILGGVLRLYTPLISDAAVELFAGSDVKVFYDEHVPAIINRAGTGICPVESLCRDCQSAEECLPLIKKFIEQQQIK